jgi:hypothetical protein
MLYWSVQISHLARGLVLEETAILGANDESSRITPLFKAAPFEAIQVQRWNLEPT